ncbi:MAG: fibronectin type III domain-containing protein [Sinobacteraceae bacterium]|nr:fibronectin type III domain-containing protein [Nevskiaceae bacterium]
MMSGVAGLRSVLITGMALGAVAGAVTGCGTDGSSAGSTASGTIDRPSSASGSQTDGAGSGQDGETNTSGAVTLSWDAPTDNADGSVLMDLAGYKVHYGSASKDYTGTIEVDNPGLTNYVVQNLPAGTYYFAISSYNSNGVESSLSGEVSTQVLN